MRKLLLNLGIGCLVMMSACTSDDIKPSEEYMILDKVEYVKDFPIEMNLTDAQETGFDILGLLSFQITDSVMFVSRNAREGFWQFYSMNDRHLIGEMLNIGQGPNEFIFPLYDPNSITFVEDGSKLYSIFHDMVHKYVYRLDITSTLQTKELDMQVISKDFGNNVFVLQAIDEKTFLCREMTGGNTRQERYLMSDGEKIVPVVLEKLNRAAVLEKTDDGISFNVISAAIRKHGDIIIEAPIYLNYLNLYTLDGSISMTVCIDDRLSSISYLTTEGFFDRKQTFTWLRAFDDFFGVIYTNLTMKEEELGSVQTSQVMLFDYNGRPLALLNVDKPLSLFDIDFKEGALYAFCRKTDEFVKYDINSLLVELKVK